MSSAAEPCPIWDGIDDNLLAKVKLGPQVCGTLRSGGMFVLDISGAIRLKLRPPTDRQKANLSYWIYHHNFLFWQFEWPTRQEALLVLDNVWVDGHRDREPSTSKRVVTYLRELIRSADADRSPSKDLLMAAGGCPNPRALLELQRHTVEEGWTGSNKPGSEGTDPFQINTSARIYVEQQRGKQDDREQVFVAMWFDDSMDEALECGIKPAICAAGYKPLRNDSDRYLGPVPDRILHNIRKSRFVVADVTGCEQCTACEKCKQTGAPGGVYYEAGFAHALDIPVIYTCRKVRKDTVHFDVDHLYRIEWEDSQDLREQLHELIVDVLGHGPRSSSSGDQEVVGSNSSLAA